MVSSTTASETSDMVSSTTASETSDMVSSTTGVVTTSTRIFCFLGARFLYSFLVFFSSTTASETSDMVSSTTGVVTTSARIFCFLGARFLYSFLVFFSSTTEVSLTNEDKSSPVNPRTPTLVPRSGVLAGLFQWSPEGRAREESLSMVLVEASARIVVAITFFLAVLRGVGLSVLLVSGIF